MKITKFCGGILSVALFVGLLIAAAILLVPSISQLAVASPILTDPASADHISGSALALAKVQADDSLGLLNNWRYTGSDVSRLIAQLNQKITQDQGKLAAVNQDIREDAMEFARAQAAAVQQLARTDQQYQQVYDSTVAAARAAAASARASYERAAMLARQAAEHTFTLQKTELLRKIASLQSQLATTTNPAKRQQLQNQINVDQSQIVTLTTNLTARETQITHNLTNQEATVATQLATKLAAAQTQLNNRLASAAASESRLVAALNAAYQRDVASDARLKTQLTAEIASLQSQLDALRHHSAHGC